MFADVKPCWFSMVMVQIKPIASKERDYYYILLKFFRLFAFWKGLDYRRNVEGKSRKAFEHEGLHILCRARVIGIFFHKWVKLTSG